METKIEWCERTLPALLDILEDRLPLRHRELFIHGDAPMHGIFVRVCDSGHVHLFHGPLVPSVGVAINGLLAYALARMLDGAKRTPKRPHQTTIDAAMSGILAVLNEVDDSFAILFSHHAEIVMSWLQTYTKLRTGMKYWPDRPDGSPLLFVDSPVQPKTQYVIDDPVRQEEVRQGTFHSEDLMRAPDDSPTFLSVFGGLIKPGDA